MTGINGAPKLLMIATTMHASINPGSNARDDGRIPVCFSSATDAHPEEPESSWPADVEFRAELRQLQRDLHPYAVDFARMAGFDGYVEVIGLGGDADETSDAA